MEKESEFSTNKEEKQELETDAEKVEKEKEDSSKLQEYEQTISNLKKEVEEYNYLFLKARADLENFRKRTRKEMEETLRFAVLPLVEKLLPVLDNFKLALKSTKKSLKETNSNKLASFFEGIKMVYKQLEGILKDFGLAAIEAKNTPFNPNFHNAIEEVETNEFEPGLVVEELQKGYKFLDRVIRPALVKVSKRTGEDTKEESEKNKNEEC